MRIKQRLAIILALCMLITALAPSAEAVGIWANRLNGGKGILRENVLFDLLDGSLFDLDLFQNDWDNSLKIEKIEDNQMVKILIIMDELSVVETDPKATYSASTQATMDALTAGQKSVIAAIEREVLQGGTLTVNYSYTWLLNGIAVTVPYGVAKQIEKVSGVKQVVLQPQYEVCATTGGSYSSAELMTTSSGAMIGRDEVWANGYTGKGIKIAVIDTGLDDDHKNFQPMPEENLTDDSATLDNVAALLDQLNATKIYNDVAIIDKTPLLTAEDLYRSNKVVFGFNYADKNLNITHDEDEMGDHGTHVSGIAAANKVEGSDVVGVAPDAQLYIMKVYGADHGGYAEDILAALEDALLLGADVINMSLGTNAGFTTGAEHVNEIYNRVSQTNTVLSVASGNNYTSGYGNHWGDNKNQTMHPDNAIISQPSVYNNVLSVASVENTQVWRRYIAAGDLQIRYVETTGTYDMPSVDILEGTYQLVRVPGNGAVKDFEGLDLTGKIALIKRGVETFGDKCENAEAAGAIACLIYNNEADKEFGMDLTGCEAKIPCVSILKEDGEKLVKMLEEDPELTVSFPKDEVPMGNSFAHQMSDFSSWGVAPDLSLEPDITAPGGNIYSTVNDSKYGLMSGTSMAAPHMSGLVALVMQCLREEYPNVDLPMRELVQHLLVSTSTPLRHEESGWYYSPRQQGSGLGNALLAITTEAYLSVVGMDTPKAELGDDDAKTGEYDFTYQVNNFSDHTLYYRLSTTVQTEDFTTSEDHPGRYFMAGTPRGLGGMGYESSDHLFYTHDLDENGLTDSHDAYLLYLQSLQGNNEKNSDTFRYDVNKDEAVGMDDVQAYLDSLVGLVSKADLKDQVLQVPAGETVEVSVNVKLTAADKAFLNTYYPNGGYVEGFTMLEAVDGTDLSLPYLGFFGDWDAAPILDDGYYWQLLDEQALADMEEKENEEESDAPEEGEDGDEDDKEDEDFKDEELEEDSKSDVIVGNQYAHVLWTEFYGMHASFYPGFNPYVPELFDMSHISISPDGDGYVDTIDDIYVSLMRNARYLTFRYVDADTGEVYYEQTAEFAGKSYYAAAYSQILPTIYSWLEDQIMPYNFTDSTGKILANNTHLLLQVEAIGDYEGATPEMMEIPVNVDLQAPELLDLVKTTDEDGKVWLELTFRDNLSVAAVALFNSDGEEQYYMEGTEDPEPDAEGYRNYTAKFDITDLKGKLMIVLADYALNEGYYGLNLAGEGTPYGDLVAYQYDFEAESTGWVAFGEGVNKDEIQITMDEMGFESAEYVGGFVFAQTDSGALYGFRYQDLLEDRMDVDNIFVAQLERTYHDLVYDYVSGQLYGLISYEDGDGYPMTEIYTINLWGNTTHPTTGEGLEPYAETWFYSRGGLQALCITADNAGTMYLLGTGEKGDTELWVSYESSFGMMFQKKMTLDQPIDYAQSMAFNHNNGKLYWAQFYPTSISTFLTELFELDVQAGTYQSVGTLSGETCGLFSPLQEETLAASPIYQNIPVMDPNVVGTPMLRKDVVNMNVGAEETLVFDMDPWYTNHRQVLWSSSDETVVTVDENGHIVAVGKGTAVITAAAADDPTCADTCLVTVTELTLEIEGVISSMGAGTGNAGGTKLYKYVMTNSVADLQEGELIFAPKDLRYGLDMATSVFARGYIWACEYGNTGMIYKIDPATGEVVDALMPVDGDMLFGMTYNENLDTFTGIMNMYLFVDLELTHEEQEKMLESYDPEAKTFTYHRINMLEYLLEAGSNFVTGEYGQGASSNIVMCGVTTITDSYHYVDTKLDYLGRDAYDMVNYNATQTLVVLDNVGRLWYIDEICGLTKTETRWSTTYTSATDPFTNITSYTGSERAGIIELDNGDGTCNVFYLRTIEETPLTDLFRAGTMPRITYHFSDIEFGGYTADGSPIFALSLYDYWNNGTTNELYLYTPEMTRYDETLGAYVKVGRERFYYLGNTGQYNVIASIHHFEVLGGLDD